MQIILTGTNHSNEEQDVEVTLIFDKEDTWTFKFGKTEITISDLTKAMRFLEVENEIR